ncbi:hypothetical protein KC329_g14264, partial [Hortaea werneckii]
MIFFPSLVSFSFAHPFSLTSSIRVRSSRKTSYGIGPAVHHRNTRSRQSQSSLPNLAAPHLARLLLRPTPLLPFKLAPKERLSLISRHFNSHAHVPLNTPFSIERQSSPSDDIEREPLNKKPQEIKQLTQKRTFGTQTEAPPAEEQTDESKEETQKPANMSSQAPHPALLIPGPIEFDDAVLQSMSHYSEPHTGM